MTMDIHDEFRVGQVIVRSFTVLFRNIVPFSLLALLFMLLIYAMVIGLGLLGYAEVMEEPESLNLSARFFVAIGAMAAAYVVLYYLLTGAIVYGTVQDLRGEKASVAACIARGLAQVGPVIAVAVLLGLMFSVGFMLLVIPGIILACVYGAAIPVAVVERPGIIASLSRSAELTRGNRWRILGTFLVMFAIQAVAGALVNLPIAMVPEGSIAASVIGVLDFLVQVLSAALNAVVIAVIYHDLRVTQEGADSEAIAAVFD